MDTMPTSKPPSSASPSPSRAHSSSRSSSRSRSSSHSRSSKSPSSKSPSELSSQSSSQSVVSTTALARRSVRKSTQRGRRVRGASYRTRGARGRSYSRQAYSGSACVSPVICNEPYMNMLSVIDTSTVSYPVFAPKRKQGINLPSGFIPSPLNFFLLFFDNNMIDEICINSNSFTEIYSEKYKSAIVFIQRMD